MGVACSAQYCKTHVAWQIYAWFQVWVVPQIRSPATQGIIERHRLSDCAACFYRYNPMAALAPNSLLCRIYLPVQSSVFPECVVAPHISIQFDGSAIASIVRKRRVYLPVQLNDSACPECVITPHVFRQGTRAVYLVCRPLLYQTQRSRKRSLS